MELRLDAEKWRKRRGMTRLLRALAADEGQTRYVGGAVRDELLGLPVSDVDLATRLLPEDVVERLEKARIKAVPTGIDHGTVTAVSDGQPVEITSLRRDVSTDGRRATIAFTDDWKEDAARRDFTINALSADPVTGEIFDYFGGLDDLEGRHIRFIGNPLQRIAEDHLRILRFFRFHARFGSGEPDAAALDACTARANDIMALSRERIADELLKLLGMPDPSPTMRIMLERGILKPVLPEIEAQRIADLDTLISSERAAGIAPDAIRRVLVCSGKIFFALDAAREAARREDIAIVRVEQLYPFPSSELSRALGRYPRTAELLWVQEEPANQGAWNFVRPILGNLVRDRGVHYVGRDEAASPATGHHRVHQAEEKTILERALGQPDAARPPDPGNPAPAETQAATD